MFPEYLGGCIDMLYEMREERLKLQREIDELKEKEEALKTHILNTFEEEKLEGSKGVLATASITRRVVARPLDWDAIFQYVKINDAFDLLQRRITDTAYRDRLEHGEQVPGVEPFTVIGLSLTKSRKD